MIQLSSGSVDETLKCGGEEQEQRGVGCMKAKNRNKPGSEGKKKLDKYCTPRTDDVKMRQKIEIEIEIVRKNSSGGQVELRVAHETRSHYQSGHSSLPLSPPSAFFSASS